MKFLLNHGQQQHCLQHCERSSHANARSTSKWEISEPRNFSRANRIFAPALRIESLWIRKEARIALRQELENKNIRTGGHAIPANLAVRNGAATNAPNGRVEAHRFLKNHFGVVKARDIFDGGLAAAKNFSYLFH